MDLDVYQQAVTRIGGLQLSIAVADGVLAGTIDVPELNSSRFSRVRPTRGWQEWDNCGWSSYGGDSNGSGVFQSGLRVPKASWPTRSPILTQLLAATTVVAGDAVR